MEEYKPIGIKTTGIPTVSRPGKAPVPPKVMITKKNTVYAVKKKITGSGSPSKAPALKDTKTGKPASNPAAITTPSAWTIGTKKGGSIRSVATDPANNPTNAVTQVKNTLVSIGTAIKNFFTGFR